MMDFVFGIVSILIMMWRHRDIRTQMGSRIFWLRYQRLVLQKIWIWGYICLRGIFMIQAMDIKMRMEIL